MNEVRRYVCVVIACGMTFTIAGDEYKPLGPEWVKDGDEYKKKLEVMARRKSKTWQDGLTTYNVDLTHNKLWVIESDDGCFLLHGTTIEKNRGTRIELSRDEKGVAYEYRVALGLVTYYDFNIDGIFDAYSDSTGEGRKLYILLDNAFVAVRDSKEGFKYGPKDGGPADRKSPDGNTTYSFFKGKWKGGAN